MFRHKTKTASGPNRRALQIESLETRNMMSASPVAIPLVEQSGAALIADPLGSTPSASTAFTPAQIRSAYGFNQLSSGQNGAGQTIAIVVADNVFVRFGITNGSYDYSKPLPSLQDDLHTFDQKYNIPDVMIDVHTEDKADIPIQPTPDKNRSWYEVEAALDVEWAHAIAPGAKIVLFEAASTSLDDLAKSASQAAALPGVSVVSMSWSTPEFSKELTYDHYFTTPSGHAPVTFVTGSGDTGYRSYDSNGNQVTIGGPQYPAASYNVISVGGTALTLSATSGSYGSETGWSWETQANDPKLYASGGGISQYENQPTYQKPLFPSVKRTTPDVAYNGDMNTPYSIYFSDAAAGWMTACGTSAGTPQWAGMIAIANQGRLSHSLPVLHSAISDIYALSANDFHDITTGNNGFNALTGYDLVTGRGTPKANLIVSDLIAFKEPILIILPPVNSVPNAGNTQLALPNAPLLSGLNTPPATDLTAGNLLDPVRTDAHSQPIAATSVTPLAVQPIDFGALLANSHSDDQVDHLIDSLFDFIDHAPTHHTFGINFSCNNRR